jgi:hypothetical protein
VSRVPKAYAPHDPSCQLWAQRVLQALRDDDIQQEIADDAHLSLPEVREVIEFILAAAEKGVET